MKYLVVIFLLLPVVCWGDQVSLVSNDSGLVVYDGDTVTVSGTKASFNHWGLLLDCSGDPDTIVVDLGTDTLEYNTDGNDLSFGITVSGNFDSDSWIEITGGVILDGQPDSTADSCCCISIMGSYNTYIHDVDMIQKGRDSQILTTAQPSRTLYGSNASVSVTGGSTFKNLHVRKCDAWNHCRYYRRRDYYLGSAFKVNEYLNGSLAEGEYHTFLDTTNIHLVGHVGAAGYGKFIQLGCSTHVDSWNWASDSLNYEHQVTNINAWMTSLSRAQAGSKINGNALTTGVNFSGGAGGVLIEAAQGTEANPCSVSYNRFHRLTSGFSWYVYGGDYDTLDQTAMVTGIRVRWGDDWVYIVGNEIELYFGDTDSLNSVGRPAIGQLAVGFDFYSEIEGNEGWGESDEPCSSVYFTDNIINIIPIADDYDKSSKTRGGFGYACGINGYNWKGSGCMIQGNTINAPNGYFLKRSYSYQHKCYDFYAESDTINLIDSGYTDVNCYVVTLPYSYLGPSIDNFARDVVLSDTFTIQHSYVSPSYGEADFTFEFTCSLLVVGNNNKPAYNQEVKFVDAYDDTSYDTTNALGWVNPVLRAYKIMEDGDSTFNNYTVLAGDSTLTGYVSEVSANDTIYLEGDLRKRVSVLSMGRSVMRSAVKNCYGPAYGPRNIRDVLDTLGNGRIHFRFMCLNYVLEEDSCLTDSVKTGSCEESHIDNSGFSWSSDSREKIINYPASGNDSPILENVFNQSGKEDSLYWEIFGEHYIHYTESDSVWEDYDIVILKNPYIIWRDVTQARVDSIKNYYNYLADSCEAHSLPLHFAFGTPLCYQASSDDDFDSDTSLAKMVYDLATWFIDTLDYDHKFDCYRPLCNTNEGNPYRYCLDTLLWAGAGSESHLSSLGAESLQVLMINYIDSAVNIVLGDTTTPAAEDTAELAIDLDTIAVTDSSVRLEADITTGNGGACDTLVFYILGGDSIAIPSPSDPQDTGFYDLTASFEYSFYCRGVDNDSSLTRWSDTVTVTTDAEPAENSRRYFGLKVE